MGEEANLANALGTDKGSIHTFAWPLKVRVWGAIHKVGWAICTAGGSRSVSRRGR